MHQELNYCDNVTSHTEISTRRGTHQWAATSKDTRQHKSAQGSTEKTTQIRGPDPAPVSRHWRWDSRQHKKVILADYTTPIQILSPLYYTTRVRA